MERPPQLGDLLVSVGMISKQQLAQALQHQKEYGGMLGQVLVKLGACTEDDIRGALEAQAKRTPLAERLAVIKGREATTEAQGPSASEVGWRFSQAFERELRRIAKDIQDMSQVLGEMSLQTELARKTLAASPQAAEQTLGQMWEQLRVVTRELDYYATELAPPSLEDPNLLAALRQYAAHYRTCFGGSLDLTLRSDDVRTSRQTALGLFRALQCLLRGVGNSEGSHDIAVVLSVADGQAVVEMEFERIRSSEGAMGDPIGELEERVALLGGQTDREGEGDRVRILCRVPTGPVPPAPRSGGIVIS